MPDGLIMIDVKDVLQLQAETVERWHRQDIDNPFTGVLAIVCDQHSDNFRLWHEEDSARSPSSDDTVIANVKRRIDKLNQSRNDRIELLDEWLREALSRRGVVAQPEARINTETPGSAIDRLSILALRLYHLHEQLNRNNVGERHIASVEEKIAICDIQKNRLARALTDLLAEIATGACRHETFRQFKMYNDAQLNPYLYEKS